MEVVEELGLGGLVDNVEFHRWCKAHITSIPTEYTPDKDPDGVLDAARNIVDERKYVPLGKLTGTGGLLGYPFPYGTPREYVKYRDATNARVVALAEHQRLIRRGRNEVKYEIARLQNLQQTSPNLVPDKTIMGGSKMPKRLSNWTMQDFLKKQKALRRENDNLKKAKEIKIPKEMEPPREDLPPMIWIEKGPLKQHTATVIGTHKSCEIKIPNPQWKTNKPSFCTNIDGMDDFNAEEYGEGWDDETAVTQLLGSAVWRQFERSKTPSTNGKDENTASLDNQVHATNARYTEYIMIIEKPLDHHWNAFAEEEWCIVAREEARRHPNEKAIFLGYSNVPKNVKALPMFAAYNECKKSGKDHWVISTWRRLQISALSVEFQRYLSLATIERIMHHCRLNKRWFKIPEDLKTKLIASHAAVSMGYVNTAQIISVHPKQIMITTYANENSKQEYRTDAFISAHVFGDREDFMIALSTNSTFTGTLLKVKCQAGNRINADENVVLCPPIPEPALFEIQWKVGNDDMKCVPSAFVNLFFILQLTEDANQLQLEFSDLNGPITETAMSTCLKQCSKNCTYKNLDLIDAKKRQRHPHVLK